MYEDSKRQMNPGSKEAYAKGCTCPIIDNRYGAGFGPSLPYNPLFVISENCPIHGGRREKCLINQGEDLATEGHITPEPREPK